MGNMIAGWDIFRSKVHKSGPLKFLAFHTSSEPQNLLEASSMRQQDQKIPEHDLEYYSENHALHM
jgi:hypothetical protein